MGSENHSRVKVEFHKGVFSILADEDRDVVLEEFDTETADSAGDILTRYAPFADAFEFLKENRDAVKNCSPFASSESLLAAFVSVAMSDLVTSLEMFDDQGRIDLARKIFEKAAHIRKAVADPSMLEVDVDKCAECIAKSHAYETACAQKRVLDALEIASPVVLTKSGKANPPKAPKAPKGKGE